LHHQFERLLQFQEWHSFGRRFRIAKDNCEMLNQWVAGEPPDRSALPVERPRLSVLRGQFRGRLPHGLDVGSSLPRFEGNLFALVTGGRGKARNLKHGKSDTIQPNSPRIVVVEVRLAVLARPVPLGREQRNDHAPGEFPSVFACSAGAHVVTASRICSRVDSGSFLRLS